MMRYPGDADERVRVERPEATAQGGIDPATVTGDPEKTKVWWEKVAWLCCGIKRDEDGEISAARMRRQRAAEPLFVGATNTDVVV